MKKQNKHKTKPLRMNMGFLSCELFQSFKNLKFFFLNFFPNLNPRNVGVQKWNSNTILWNLSGSVVWTRIILKLVFWSNIWTQILWEFLYTLHHFIWGVFEITEERAKILRLNPMFFMVWTEVGILLGIMMNLKIQFP